MEERNWEYKGLQLSNRTKLYNFQVTSVPNKISYASEVKNNRNNNGAYTTNVTAGARTFKFTGNLYGTKAQQEEAYTKLKAIIKTEDFPSIENKGFYTLNWTDKRGKDVTVQAKVYQPLTTSKIRDDILSFEFVLLAEDSFYRWQENKTANGGIGILGGNILPNVLPNTLLGGSDSIEITNEGDAKAGMYIQVLGNLVNPRITNLTTGQSMRVVTTTDNLIVDNTKKPFIITNNGANIKSLQEGEYVYLVSGVNKILISCDNYTANDQATVYIRYQDTYE